MKPLVIGLTGAAGSGKSTVAGIIARHTGARRVRFSEPLKAMLAIFYVTCGLKDDQISERIEGSLKEVPDHLLAGRTPRHAMQTLGTEWGRCLMDDLFWINAWVSRTEAFVLGTSESVVAEDCRFPNEARAVLTMGGVVVSVETGGVNRREASAHISETPLPDALISHRIYNTGTLEDLEAQVVTLLRSLTIVSK